MDLPIKVEGILYAKRGNDVHFLLIKRVPEDGGFWQPLTGTLEDGEKLNDCLKRELLEEIGVNEPKYITEEVYRFDWKNKSNQTIIEIVFGVEVTYKQKITLSDEHDDCRWCSYAEAIATLEKENNKKSLQMFYYRLLRGYI